MQRHDVVCRTGLVREVLQIEGHDGGRAGRDRCGENMPILGVICQALLKPLEPVHGGLRKRGPHCLQTFRGLGRCDAQLARHVALRFIEELFGPSRLEEVGLGEREQKVAQVVRDDHARVEDNDLAQRVDTI